MPWCPNCSTEYREGFTHCTDCGADLVEQPPAPSPEASGEPEGPELVYNPADVFLCTADTGLDAEQIVDLLREEGIAAGIRRGGAGRGSVLLPVGVAGFDVYVEEGEFHRARGLLSELEEASAAEADFPEAEEQPEDEPLKPEDHRIAQRVFVWVIIAVLALILLLFGPNYFTQF